MGGFPLEICQYLIVEKAKERNPGIQVKDFLRVEGS